MSKPTASAFAAQGKKYIGTSYQEMDCQGFVEAMLEDVGIKRNWKGSNAMWRDMAWTGTPEECKAKFGCVPVGAWLFILDDNGGEKARGYNDGLGDATHVGVKTGQGKGAIHSSASRNGVVESEFTDKAIRNGGWNRVGLTALLDYGETINRVIMGMKGDETMSITVMKVVSENGKPVNMRGKASTSGALINRVEVGETVSVNSISGDWASIIYGGRSGFMMAKFLTPVTENAGDTDETNEEALSALSVRIASLEEVAARHEERIAALEGGAG